MDAHMLMDGPALVNRQFSQFAENSKKSFLHACLDAHIHIFPLHSIDTGPDGGPICACNGGAGCGTVGKHPQGKWSNPWNPAAAGIGDVLDAWINDKPDRGWGNHLGLSRLVCVDIDPKKGGFDSLALLRSRGILAGVEPQVVTGSGGYHFYFLAPDNCDPRLGWQGPNGDHRCFQSPLPGIDLCAGQHYMVLPWSCHKNGNVYVLKSPDLFRVMPDNLAEFWSSLPCFNAAAAPARVYTVVERCSGTPADSHTVERARRYIAATEPPVHDGSHSRRAGRIARLCSIDFGLDRHDSRMLLMEWDARCGDPIPLPQIERLLDFGENGRGSRGWRNNVEDGGLTADERKTLEAYKDVKIEWDYEPKPKEKVSVEDVQEPKEQADAIEGRDAVVDDLDDLCTEGRESQTSKRGGDCPRCRRWISRIFRKRGTSFFFWKSFPCRGSDCEGCHKMKKALYRLTIARHLWAWAVSFPKGRIPLLYLMTVDRYAIDGLLHRLRSRRGKFFAVEIGGMGSIPGPQFLVLSTLSLENNEARDVDYTEGCIELHAAIDAMPFGCRGKVFRSSRCWKLVDDGEEKTGENELVCKPGATTEISKKILAYHNIDTEPISGRSRFFPWHGFKFSCDPDQVADVLRDLEAGDTLGADVEFISGSDPPPAPATPGWEREFMSG